MEPYSAGTLLSIIVGALLTGLLVALVVYLILALVNLAVAIAEPVRRQISGVTGALCALLYLVSRLA